MNLFDSFVQKAIKDGMFLDVDRDGFDSEIAFGVIFQESETFLCLKTVDDNGDYDGVVVIRKDDISYIGTGGNRRTATEQLVSNREELNFEIVIDLSSMRSAIESISSKFGYVAIYEEDHSEDFYMGEILEIDDEFLLLHQYGSRESLDRSKILLRLDSITRIEADGKYAKSILQMFSKK